MRQSCVIFVANRGFALAESRARVIDEFLGKGWEVVVATAEDKYSRMLEEKGAILEKVQFSRGGFSIAADISAYLKLYGIYRRYQPTLVHQFHAKPMILGTLAAQRVSGEKPIVINTVTGLGNAFNQKGVARSLANIGYRLAMPHAAVTIFQNPEDRQLFLDEGWVTENAARLIVGSGVDIHRFRPLRVKPGGEDVTVLMISRLLWQKGVAEYMEVARQIKSEVANVRFRLAGELDEGHPSGMKKADLADVNADNAVDYIGYADKPEREYMNADIFVFPSYYREGVPRVVLEASACGLPTVAADVAGTREAVIQGESGYLVEPRNVPALKARLIELIRDIVKRREMGQNAREMVKERFDIGIITEKQLDIYRGSHIEI